MKKSKSSSPKQAKGKRKQPQESRHSVAVVVCEVVLAGVTKQTEIWCGTFLHTDVLEATELAQEKAVDELLKAGFSDVQVLNGVAYEMDAFFEMATYLDGKQVHHDTPELGLVSLVFNTLARHVRMTGGSHAAT